MTALLTITLLTTICAVSLYVCSQDTNATSQTASWQVALSGAESGVEQAYYALNKGQWTNWSQVTGSLPTTQPSGGSTINAAPTSGKYNYFVRTLQLSGEGAPTVRYWVTIDTAGLPLDHNSNQWYRIRATGVASAPGPARVSNSKKDNDLRRISLRIDRLTGQSVSTPQAARSIEVIAQAVPTATSGNAATLATWIDMSGGGVIDSFDSGSGLYSTNHLYDSTKRLSNGDIGLVASTSSSNLRNTYVYGDIVYSGTTPKNTTNVQGNISSPFNGGITSTSNPTWAAGSYTNYASGGSVPVAVTSGTTSSPLLVKINGDFTVGGGQSFAINPVNANSSNNAIIIWVTGKLTTSGSGTINQDSHVNVTWYVDNDITVSGSSYNNNNGYATNMSIIGVGTGHKATISGSGNFIGVLNAPGFDVTVSGGGSFCGSLTANTLTISGGSGLHYDQALSGGSNTDHFSYASWFEDAADVARGATY